MLGSRFAKPVLKGVPVGDWSDMVCVCIVPIFSVLYRESQRRRGREKEREGGKRRQRGRGDMETERAQKFSSKQGSPVSFEIGICIFSADLVSILVLHCMKQPGPQADIMEHDLEFQPKG